MTTHTHLRTMGIVAVTAVLSFGAFTQAGQAVAQNASTPQVTASPSASLTAQSAAVPSARHATIQGSAPVISFGGLNTATEDEKFNVTMLVGQPYAGKVQESNSPGAPRAEFGFWNQLLRAPEPALLDITQGNFNDKIVMEWDEDPLHPAINPQPGKAYYRVYKQDALATTVVSRSTGKEYIDTQINPGKFYNYAVQSQNTFGWSALSEDLGFSNATATVTGVVKTQSFNGEPGRPVADMQVSVKPYGAQVPFVGSSAQMDGIATYMQTQRLVRIPTDSAFSIEMMVLNQTQDSFAPLVTYGDSESGFEISIIEGDRLGIRILGQEFISSPINLTPGEWTHYAVVKDLGTMQLFINSEPVLDVPLPAPLPLLPFNRLTFGMSKEGYFKGLMDEIRVWRTARTAQEIHKFSGSTVPARQPALLAYWNLNEGTGTIAVDWTRNGHNLRLFDGVRWSVIPAPVLLASFTDANGRYAVEGITYDYNNGTQYEVHPFKEFHDAIDPISENVNFLGTNNNATVNFVDRSELTINGRIVFEGTQIGVDSAEVVYMLKQGNEWPADTITNYRAFSPNRILTNERGEFLVHFLPTTDVRLKIIYGEHDIVFEPLGGSATNFFQVEALSAPIADLKFVDRTKYTMSLTVKGGREQHPIGAFNISYTGKSPSGVNYPETGSLAAETNAAGEVIIPNLPPLRYDVLVTHKARPDSIQIENAQVISLRDSSNSAGFTWYAPLEIEITGLDTLQRAIRLGDQAPREVIVLEQNELYDIRIRGIERYGVNGDSITVLQGGIVDVIDDISGRGTVADIGYSEGQATYTLAPYLPNFTSAGDNPYQFSMTAVIKDTTQGRTATGNIWALTTGIGEGGNTFRTTSPSIPFLVLYDPPGDQSQSYLEKGGSHSFTYGLASESNQERDLWFTRHMGATVSFGNLIAPFGVGVEIGFDTELILDLGVNTTTEVSQSNSYEHQMTTTFNERFATSAGDELVGPGADLFVGGAFNFINGISNVLEIDGDENGDSVLVYRDIISLPEGFATTFMYTRHAIENNVIPNLLDMQTAKDSSDAVLWQDILAASNQRKISAKPYTIESGTSNISFSGGVEFERSVTTEIASVQTFEWQNTVDISTEFTAGIRVGGHGLTGGFTYNNRMSIGRSQINEKGSEQTVGFLLADDDANYPFSGRADQFTVDLKTDPVFGTPIFDLLAGESSNPWETSTLKRESVQLQIDPQAVANVPENENANFSLILGNLSQTLEDRRYKLGINQASNPNGATVRVNGIAIEDGVTVTIPGELESNSVTLAMSVEKGPFSHAYEDIEVIFESITDDQIGTSKTFSTYFIAPCSDIEFLAVEDGWLVNQGDDNQYSFTVEGYDRSLSNFEKIVFEYVNLDDVLLENLGAGQSAPVVEMHDGVPNLDFTPRTSSELGALKARSGVNAFSPLASQSPYAAKNPSTPIFIEDPRTSGINYVDMGVPVANSTTARGWIVFHEVEKDSLTGAIYAGQWDISQLADATYAVRARTICASGQTTSTGITTGLIDRTGPELMPGVLPEPADGILNNGDQIVFTFSEDLLPLEVYQDSIIITDLSTNDRVAKSWSVEDNKIYLSIQTDNRFIENHKLHIELRGITDAKGNAAEHPVEYTILVDRNLVVWEDGNIEAVMTPSGSNLFTFRLRNGYGNEVDFEMISLPSWIRANPETGTIPPNGSRTVEFEVERGLNYGRYETSLLAKTLNGDEPLVFNLRVMADPPQWEVNPEEYEYTMSLIGRLYMQQEDHSRDPYDMVAAFVNGEPRGVARVRSYPSVDDSTRHLVMLTAYSNQPSGDTLEFRAWRAEDGVEFARTLQTYPFQDNTVVGTTISPISFVTTDDIYYRKPIPAGWNWLSFNVLRDNDFIGDYVGRFIQAGEGDIVKTLDQFIQFNSQVGWVGNLTGLDITSGYLIRLSYDNTIETTGAPVNPAEHPIELDAGWNLISYLPDKNYTPNYALSGRTFKTGDLIKSQDQFAFYTADIGWVGSLAFMKPTEAYMIRVADEGEFLYPSLDQVLNKAVPGSSGGTTAPLPSPATPPTRENGGPVVSYSEATPTWPGATLKSSDYEFNMTVTAQIQHGGTLAETANFVLGAFVGEELRGIASPTLVGPLPYYFLMVYHDSFSGADVTFKYLDTRDSSIVSLTNKLAFESNKIHGSLAQPVLLTTPNATSTLVLGDEIPDRLELKQNYPNPFNPSTSIRFGIPLAGPVKMSVYDLLGRRVTTLLDEPSLRAGWHQITFDAGSLASGSYFYRIETASGAEIRKLTLIK